MPRQRTVNGERRSVSEQRHSHQSLAQQLAARAGDSESFRADKILGLHSLATVGLWHATKWAWERFCDECATKVPEDDERMAVPD
jgi:hypothetical protein